SCHRRLSAASDRWRRAITDETRASAAWMAPWATLPAQHFHRNSGNRHKGGRFRPIDLFGHAALRAHARGVAPAALARDTQCVLALRLPDRRVGTGAEYPGTSVGRNPAPVADTPG